jgi:hypothetical protein
VQDKAVLRSQESRWFLSLRRLLFHSPYPSVVHTLQSNQMASSPTILSVNESGKVVHCAAIVLLNHLWRPSFMLRPHPTGYAQHERALKSFVLSVAEQSRRANAASYSTSHLGSPQLRQRLQLGSRAACGQREFGAEYTIHLRETAGLAIDKTKRLWSRTTIS